MEMRQTFSFEMDKYMAQNENIVLLNADLAKPNGLSEISEKYPERCINVGVAEQNMAGIAAGMSSYGFIPFIFTFTPFATRRICDQIAVSIAYAGQNVKIVGTDPGISAEYNGGTHMSVEDIGILRSIPNMVIFEPVDNSQLKKALVQILNFDKPLYIRMFRKELPDVFSDDYNFDLFKADIIKEGKDVTIICSGIMVQEVLEANKKLSDWGINAEIINIHTIKPIDEDTIIKSAAKTKHVITAENHNIVGGLGSAVSEVLSQRCPTILKCIGIKDSFGQVGKMPYLKQEYNMDSRSIVSAVLEILKR
ncbi:MAG: transketolase family protein [Oscillospiraceae bacterium]|jgi:transketolase|nr:transketolase family protein [Oscillospiraceae bacterium]